MTLAVVRDGRSPAPRRTLHHGTPGSGHHWIVTTPGAEPDLWAEYLEGAQRSYGAHGVERVAAVDEIADGASTALLFAAVTDAGRVVGGFGRRASSRTPTRPSPSAPGTVTPSGRGPAPCSRNGCPSAWSS